LLLKHPVLIFIISIASFAMTGCTLVERKAYEGPMREEAAIARIKAWGYDIKVEEVDGYGHGFPLFFEHNDRLTSYFQVTPGKHKVKLTYIQITGFTSGVNVSFSSYDVAESEVEFVAEAGKTYIPKADHRTKNIRFSLVDMGRTYVEDCQFSTASTPFTKNANTEAFRGIGVFSPDTGCGAY